jgi:hypothetical protein
MRPSGPTLFLMALAALVAPACSGDDDATKDKSSEGQYVDAIVTSLTKSGGGFGDAKTDRCVAQAYVDAIGLAHLRAKTTPAEIKAKPDAEPQDFGLKVDDRKLYAGMGSCFDVDGVMLSLYAHDDAPVACLKTKLTAAQGYSLFVSTNNDKPIDPAVDAALKKALAACKAG